MSCKPTYKGVRYNSLEELYKANGVNEQQKQEAQQKFQEYINANGRQDIEGFKEFVQKSELFNIGNIEQYSLYRNQFSNQLGFNGNPIVFGSEEDIQAFSDYLDNTIQDFTYKDDSPILQSAKNKYKRIGFESKDNYEDPKESETKVHSTKQKYAPISDYLESNIRNINNRILNLKNKIKVEKNPIIKKQLNAKLNKFEERLEAYELEKQELPKISGVEQLMAYGDAAIARVSTLLEQNNLSDADIEEARKLVQV